MAKMYPAIGAMQMPAGFKYKEVLRRGRPSHEKWDSFFIKHPPMAPSRWAKIFAPFDALDGFDERIQAKEELYVERKDPDEGEKEELSRKLRHLHSLTMNGRLARINAPAVTVTYFLPCTDIENEWYGCGGKYKKISGTVLQVETDCIRIKTGGKEKTISFSDIRGIDYPHSQAQVEFFPLNECLAGPPNGIVEPYNAEGGLDHVHTILHGTISGTETLY